MRAVGPGHLLAFLKKVMAGATEHGKPGIIVAVAPVGGTSGYLVTLEITGWKPGRTTRRVITARLASARRGEGVLP